MSCRLNKGFVLIFMHCSFHSKFSKSFAEELNDFLRFLSLLEYCPARSCKNIYERTRSSPRALTRPRNNAFSVCYLCMFKDRKPANPKQLCSQRDARKVHTICDSLIYVNKCCRLYIYYMKTVSRRALISFLQFLQFDYYVSA